MAFKRARCCASTAQTARMESAALNDSDGGVEMLRHELEAIPLPSEERRALELELAGLKLKALRQRARSCGVSEELLEDADDAEDIRGTVIELILDAASSMASHESEERRALELELAGLKLKALRQRARSCGVSEELLEDADDAEDAYGQRERRRAELLDLRVTALQERAVAAGVDLSAVDDALESDDTKGALIKARLRRLFNVRSRIPT
jgi:hypothetical protein